LRCDLVDFIYRLRLFDHHRDELVPVWFLAPEINHEAQDCQSQRTGSLKFRI
jgi:hypothetical protein